MARFSIMRSTGSLRALCTLTVLLFACCSDEGIRPSNGDKPVCIITPSAIDFGIVETGNFVDTMLTITNDGTIPFSCHISADSRHYEIFVVAGPDTLHEGDQLTAVLRFEPDTVGPVACAVATGCEACGDVPCTGVGIELSLCDIEPAVLDFDTLVVGEQLDTSFVIRNVGDGIIRGEIKETSEHYAIVTGGGPYAICHGESVTATVRYAPCSEGTHECAIETGTATCADLPCTGTGEYIWQKIEIGTTADLYGVWGEPGGTIAAVGDDGTIVQYDGSSWNYTSGVTTFPLYDVWGSAGYDIFVVGAARTLFHYNGYSWGFMNSPAAGDLCCIDGTGWNNVVAGGNGSIHYDGSAWNTFLETGWSLTDIWAHRATDLYAVDTTGAILHFDGADWSTIENVYTPLTAIWGSSPDNIFVVNSKGDIYNYNGELWRRIYSTFYYGLNAIWGSAPDDVYVVGPYYTVLHYDGKTWEVMLRDGTWKDTLYDVWGTSAGNIFFVGTGGAVYHYGGRIH